MKIWLVGDYIKMKFHGPYTYKWQAYIRLIVSMIVSGRLHGWYVDDLRRYRL